MNKNKNLDTDAKERRFLIIYLIITAAFLAVCALIYILTDINEQNAYVEVTALTSDAPVIPDNEKIDLNTATAEELTSVNGIGEVMAGRIIAYRDTYGSFLSIDELEEVEGIGEKLLDKLRPYLKV